MESIWLLCFTVNINPKNAIIPAKLVLFVSYLAAFMAHCCRVILSETHCKFHPTPRHVSSFFESAPFLSESHAFHNICDETRGQMEWVKHCLTLKFREKERGKDRKQGEERRKEGKFKSLCSIPSTAVVVTVTALLNPTEMSSMGGFYKQSHHH